MTDVDRSQNQPCAGTFRFRFSIGSLLLLTTCIAVLVATEQYFGPSGILVGVFCFYLALPLLFAAFVEVSLNEHDDIASRRVFSFFAIVFTAMFVLLGLSGDNGTLAAAIGPIFFWPPQLFVIVFLKSRRYHRR